METCWQIGWCSRTDYDYTEVKTISCATLTVNSTLCTFGNSQKCAHTIFFVYNVTLDQLHYILWLLRIFSVANVACQHKNLILMCNNIARFEIKCIANQSSVNVKPTIDQIPGTGICIQVIQELMTSSIADHIKKPSIMLNKTSMWFVKQTKSFQWRCMLSTKALWPWPRKL